MKLKKVILSVSCFFAAVFVLSVGAYVIYKVNNTYSVGNVEEVLIQNIVDTKKDATVYFESINTSRETVPKPVSNVGGIIETSELTSEELEYEEYIKDEEMEGNDKEVSVTTTVATDNMKAETENEEKVSTTAAEVTTVVYERETTTAAETTTTAVTAERETVAYVAEETTKRETATTEVTQSTTMSIQDIFKSLGYYDTPRGGEIVETTTIDVNEVTVGYELPYELPKPVG